MALFLLMLKSLEKPLLYPISHHVQQSCPKLLFTMCNFLYSCIHYPLLIYFYLFLTTPIANKDIDLLMLYFIKCFKALHFLSEKKDMYNNRKTYHNPLFNVKIWNVIAFFPVPFLAVSYLLFTFLILSVVILDPKFRLDFLLMDS